MKNEAAIINQVYVQYGCGTCAPDSWLNFDASPTLFFERIPVLGRLYVRNDARFPPNVRFGDIRYGLPVAPGSAAGVFCSHVLEHLSRLDCEVAVRNTHSLLAQGGIFRLMVPDLRRAAQDYVADLSPGAGHRFMDSLGMGTQEKRTWKTRLIHDALGNGRHQWMWDEESLTELLTRSGFTRIRRCSFNDSDDPRFRDVEDKDRFEKAVAMECRR